MKCLSAKGLQRAFGLPGKLIRFALETAAVGLVTEERMADGGKVHAKLVHPPGQWLELDEGGVSRQRFEHPVAGDRLLAVV